MEFSELEKLIKERYSVRQWQDKPVPEELLAKAVELALWAPNGGNQQSWHFYIVTNRQKIDALAAAVKGSIETLLTWPEAQKKGDAFATRTRNMTYFRKAPAIIVAAAAKYQSPADEILEARGTSDPVAGQMRQWRNTADSRAQTVASALSHLVLILWQMGLGSVWMTGPTQAKAEIEEVLNVPPTLDVIAFLPVGYPASTPAHKERKPFNQVCDIIR